MIKNTTRLTAALLAGTMLFSMTSCASKEEKGSKHTHKKNDIEIELDSEEEIQEKLKSYPQELVDLYDRNPETKDFVLNYYKENYSHDINLTEYDCCSSIPHFLQWDERWGYEEYNGNFLAVTGCGPTCLSMVAIYLTGDSTYSPLWMANFLDEHGYSVADVGTAWSIFTDGVQSIDLYGYQIGIQKETITSYLLSGYPVICSMGPGEFTQNGHFVVFSEYNDGYVTILDPNSIIRTKKWKLEDIEDQMVQCWAMYVGDACTDSPDYYEESYDEDYYDESDFDESDYEDEYDFYYEDYEDYDDYEYYGEDEF